MDNKMMIYQGGKEPVRFNFDESGETIWATQAQIAEVFDVTPQLITQHLKKIYADGELNEALTCKESLQVQKEGKRMVTRRVKTYNLDAMISVGYRVNSKKATSFRIWSTKILHDYVVGGAALNESRIRELEPEKLQELEGTLGVIKRLMRKQELSGAEAKGILEIISRYGTSIKTISEFEEGRISFKKNGAAGQDLKVEELKQIAEQLGSEEGVKYEADEFKLDQIFEEVFRPGKKVAEKAAELLYLIIRNEPFSGGNKQIGVLAFIIYLTKNSMQLAENGETKLSDRAVTAVALLIGESDESEKELIVQLVAKLIE
jgi:prophage maintenance system killer protein